MQETEYLEQNKDSGNMILNKEKLSFKEINIIIDKLSTKIIENKDKNVCIGLIGNLGTGKTAFAKRLFSNLGVIDSVKSPTFTYLIEYNTEYLDIYHFDVYRINNEDELYNIGYYDYIGNNNTLLFIEWADLILDEMPKNTLYFEILYDTIDTRRLSAYTLEKGEKIYVDIYNYNFN